MKPNEDSLSGSVNRRVWRKSRGGEGGGVFIGWQIIDVGVGVAVTVAVSSANGPYLAVIQQVVLVAPLYTSLA